jgi:hypothetical protein
MYRFCTKPNAGTNSLHNPLAELPWPLNLELAEAKTCYGSTSDARAVVEAIVVLHRSENDTQTSQNKNAEIQRVVGQVSETRRDAS